MQKNSQSTSFKITLITLVFILLPIKYSLANDYSLGLDAFISGDYSQAQQHWLAAAESGNVKSMFNLGLLHEQSKLPSSSSDNSSSEKAEEWYRKAANNGYPAANYHLAQRLFERGGSDDEAIELINVAADQMYAPAMRYLGEVPKATAEILVNQANKPREANGYQVEAWVNKQQKNSWTIQLLAFTHESKVQQFISDHNLGNKAAYFEEQKDGVVWYKLIYGSFNTKDKATFARQNLSAELQEYGPWLRTIASVQAITKG